MAFNANEHLIQLKSREGSKDYLPVQWRLVWFREQCPNGTIETEMIHLDLDRMTTEEVFVWNNEKKRSEKVTKEAPGIAVFRAIAKDGKGGVATGTKSEKAASFGDFIEKAETGSVGRALAALGYGTQFAPELDEGTRLADSPVERQAGGSEQGNGHQAQTTALTHLIGKAKNRAIALGIADRAQWDAFVAGILKAARGDEELSLQDVSRLNGELTKREKEKQPVELLKGA